MARPRKLHSVIQAIGDVQLKAFWQLRSMLRGSDRKIVNIEIKHRLIELRRGNINL